MTHLTKKQQQERLIEEFLRRLREAPPGERIYMAVGDLFKLAEVHDFDKWRAARRAADDDRGEDTSRSAECPLSGVKRTSR